MRNCENSLLNMQRAMSARSDRTRIAIAVTESSPLDELWRAALEYLADPQAELTALFVCDDRWHRAASLPFTCEISRLGGAIAKFTAVRAEQISNEAAGRARQLMQELATEAGKALGFEILPESDEERIRELVAGARNVLIAPSHIASRPIYAQFQKLDCRIVLIEAKEEERERE